MEEGIGCDVDDEKMNRYGNCKDSGDAIVKGDEVESTKSEMSGVMEENKRLKTLIKQIEKDYKALQMKFKDIFQPDSNKSGSPSPTINGAGSYPDDREEQNLVSLRLGTSPHGHKKEGIHVACGSSKVTDEDHELELGLGYNLRGLKADDGFSTKIDECKGDDKVGEKWPPSRVLKTQRSGDDEFPQTGVKKARVCVRARCDTPNMNDGCHWRKYGQKIAKGNPCPRAYYRCTVSPSCPVKKQVQRCVDDMSILITTYEGTHNHPLPVSATAMAATTSAAASMLLSGSSTSQAPAIGAPPTYPFGSTLHPFDNSRTQPYNLLLNSSSTPFPTITLDLTPSLSTTHGGFSLYSTNARASATDLSFSSVDSSKIPTGSGNGGFSYGRFSYDSGHQYSLLPGEAIQEQKYQPQLEKLNQASSKQALTETLTNAIKTDPSFQSVIAAAISAMAANGGAGKVNNDKGENLDQNLKWGEHIPATGSTQLTLNAKNS